MRAIRQFHCDAFSDTFDGVRTSRLLPLLLVAVLRSALAHADPHADAKVHFDKGTMLYDLGKYGDAAKEFEEAFKNVPDPALLFNIAQAERLAGDLEPAVRAYRGYLRRFPDAPNRPAIENYIATLQKQIDEKAKVVAPPREPVTPPTTASATSAPAAATGVTTPAPPTRTPVYKKWWLWTGVAVVAAGVSVGLGVGLSPRPVDVPAGATTLTFH